MDERRLNTGDFLAMGGLSRPAPETDIPEDREHLNASYEFEYIGSDKVRKAVEDGQVVESLNYYGIPTIWKDGDTYRGALLQYRSVTEDPTFESLDAAITWFEDRCASTFG